MGQHLGAHDTAGAGAAVVNHNLFAELLGEVRCEQSAHHVVTAAGRERNDQPHRLGRIFLRSGNGGERQQQARGLDQQRMDCRHGSSPPEFAQAILSSIVVIVSRSSPNQALMAAWRATMYSGQPSFCTMGISWPGTTMLPALRRQ